MTDEIIEELWTDASNTAQYFIRHNLPYVAQEDINDILTDSISLLYAKYLVTQSVTDRVQARKILFGIIKIHIKIFKRKRADEAFFSKSGNDGFDDERSTDELMSIYASNVAQRPPSYYYDKEYRKRPDVHQRWLEWSRAYYYKHHEKFLQKEQSPKRKAKRREIANKWHRDIKADPVKYAEHRAKKNEWRRQQRAAKKAGTWVDRRFYKNRAASASDTSGNA